MPLVGSRPFDATSSGTRVNRAIIIELDQLICIGSLPHTEPLVKAKAGILKRRMEPDCRNRNAATTGFLAFMMERRARRGAIL
jgi:hypothetical protein